MIPAETRRAWARRGVPWWQRVLFPVAFATLMFACLVWTVAVVALGGLLVLATRLLPQAWRPKWEPLPPDPIADGVCPGCGNPLVLGPVIRDAQDGECPACGQRFWRVYCRTTFNGFWWPWQAQEATPEPKELQ